MPSPNPQPIDVHVPGAGWQRRANLHDPLTSNLRCQFLGSVPYAEGTTRRFSRARPVRDGGYQFGPTKADAKDWSDYAENACPQPGDRVTQTSEDCQKLDIYIPVESAPKTGWPVFIFIHGGFLQWGSNRQIEPSHLLAKDSVFNAIIVSINYRLNAFGFLASKELLDEARRTGDTAGVLNLGFWDQRLAIEWVHRFIHLYGGNKANITLGGLSAGSYSTFHQLAYEIGLPDEEAVVRRIIMFSNGCGLPPKVIKEVQSHYDALLKALDIPLELPGSEQVARLRSLPSSDIMKGVEAIPENSFRAVMDGHFVRPSLFDELRSGSFARALSRRGIRVMIGDCRDERNSYYISPSASFSALSPRLAVEYPEAQASRISQLYCSRRELPHSAKSWPDMFANIYSDMQVHVTERGLIHCLSHALPNDHIFRYRVEWRTEASRKIHGENMGVCHGSDYTIWFRGNGHALTSDEDVLVKDFALKPLADFVDGNYASLHQRWGTEEISQLRQLCDDGRIRIEKDQSWQASVRRFRDIMVWDTDTVRTSKL